LVYVPERFEELSGKQRLEVYGLSCSTVKGYVEKIVTNVLGTIHMENPVADKLYSKDEISLRG
jgi:hypothetical protein